MNAQFEQIVKTRLFHTLLYHIIRAYSSTFRMTVKNEQQWINYFNEGGRVVLCTWHQQFFSVIRHFKSYSGFKPALMISRSSDGEIIAGVSEKSGWHAVRGSSSRGGREALKKMIDHLTQTGRLAAHIVDGPQGPAGIVKAGVIHLAHAADAAIVPFYVCADRAWYFRSWDSFFIPKPFARVTLSFGDLIEPSQCEDQESLENRRLHLEKAMGLQIRTNPATQRPSANT